MTTTVAPAGHTPRPVRETFLRTRTPGGSCKDQSVPLCSLLLVLIYLIRDHHRVGLFTKTRVGARMAGDRSRWAPPSINQIASDATNQDADSMLQNTLLIEESNSADV